MPENHRTLQDTARLHKKIAGSNTQT